MPHLGNLPLLQTVKLEQLEQLGQLGQLLNLPTSVILIDPNSHHSHVVRLSLYLAFGALVSLALWLAVSDVNKSPSKIV